MAQTERYRQDEHLLLYHSLSATDKELKGEFDNKKKKSPITEYFLGRKFSNNLLMYSGIGVFRYWEMYSC